MSAQADDRVQVELFQQVGLDPDRDAIAKEGAVRDDTCSDFPGRIFVDTDQDRKGRGRGTTGFLSDGGNPFQVRQTSVCHSAQRRIRSGGKA